jgi:hypothetical protein
MVSQSTSHDAVNTAENVIDVKEAGRSPGIDWRWFAGLSAFIVSLALLASILIFGGGLSRLASENQALSNCRSKYAVQLTDVEAQADIVQYKLFASLNPTTGTTQEDIDKYIADLQSLSIQIESAIQQRITFENNPTLPCPITELYYESEVNQP